MIFTGEIKMMEIGQAKSIMNAKRRRPVASFLAYVTITTRIQCGGTFAC